MSAYDMRPPSTSASMPSRGCSTCAPRPPGSPRRAAVPSRAQAAGLRRARPGAGALERARALPRLRLSAAGNGYPVRRGPVARTLVGSGGGSRRDRARRRARPAAARPRRARPAPRPTCSLAAPGGRALERLVAALGARLADADRRRPRHAQAHGLPRAPARGGLRLPQAPAHDLPPPRLAPPARRCCCTSSGTCTTCA